MTSQGGPWLAAKIAFAVIGILSGLSIFATFLAYRNVNAAIWGLISAVFAGLTLRLHLAYRQNSLHLRFDVGHLKLLKQFGFFGCFTSILVAVVYFVLAVVFKQGYKLEDNGYMPAAIFSLLTLKWTALLTHYSKKYGDILTSDKETSPITGNSHAEPGKNA